MQKLKVFISNIDKQLGRELIELFRNDHLTQDMPNVIVGTSETGIHEPGQPFHILKFNSDQNLVIKTAMESDLIVLDLVQCPPQTELIIKYMRENVSRKLPRVIAVSTFLTWMNTESYEVVEKALDQIDLTGHRASIRKSLIEAFPPVEISEDNFDYRMPTHSAQYQWNLENSLLQLRQRFDVPVSILAAGLIYGKSYDSLLSEFQTCMINRQPLVIQGEGLNTIPMIHITDLVSMIELVSEQLLSRDWRTAKPFYFAIDDSKTTQQELLENLQSVLGITEPIVKVNPVVNSSRLQNSQIHIKVKTSQELQRIDWKCRQGMVENKSKILEEFLFHRQVEFNWVETDPKSPHNAAYREAFLKKGYLIITKETLLDFIDKIQKRLVSSSSAQRVFEEIEKQRREFEQKHAPQPGKKKNVDEHKAVFTFSSNMLLMVLKVFAEEFKNRNILSLLQDLCSTSIQTHTLVRLYSNQQEMQSFIEKNKNQSSGRHIIIDSESYNSLLGLEVAVQGKPPIPKVGINTQKQEIPHPHETQPSVNAQVLHMKQYLIDNIMPVITEAIVKIQSERPTEVVPAFIEAIKLIETKRLLQKSAASKKRILPKVEE